MEKPENDQDAKQLKRLESKINILIWVAGVQSILLVAVIVMLMMEKLIPGPWTVVLLLALLALFVFVCRRFIPGWFGSVSRFLFAQMLSTKSDGSGDE